MLNFSPNPYGISQSIEERLKGEVLSLIYLGISCTLETILFTTVDNGLGEIACGNL
jgi:hypothetical protein